MKRGREVQASINPRIAQAIRGAGFLAPVMLFLYGIALQLGAMENNHLFSVPMFYAISVAWIALGAYQLLVTDHGYRESVVRLMAYHILAGLYIFFVSGLDMPFIATWIILFLSTYAYFGKSGLNLSILAFFAAGAADAIQHPGDLGYIARSGAYWLGTVIVGFIATTVSDAQKVDREALSRSQAEELLQRDRILTIVNNLADAVLSTDRDGIIQVYNAASLNLLDTNAELTGKSVDSVIKLIKPDNKPFRLIRAFRTARVVESREDLRATISGETINLSVVYTPIRSTNSHDIDNSDGYVIILRDITKQKSLEKERDEFISVVSHELRTPITIAEGSLSNVSIMMNRSDIPKATLASTVDTAHGQVMYLSKMVNDLSTLSRAERGIADAPEEINVSTLISELYNEYAPEAEEKGLYFNLDLDPALGNVVASRLYLKELVQNFVTNAIKYTKTGGILLSVKKDGKRIVFAVKDTGIGMSKSDQAHIFEKFWRSEDYRTRETGGTGLGLYVATKLARKLDTEIELTSRLNHGSTFSFSLPVADSDK